MQLLPLERRGIEVGEFSVEPADDPRDVVVAAVGRTAADRRQRVHRPAEAEPHRVREVGVGEEELDDPLRLDAADVQPLISLVGGTVLQHRAPLQVADRQVDRARSLEEGKLGVEDPQRLVGPLQVAAKLDEVPALVVDERRLAGAGEQEHARLHLLTEVVG